MIKALLKTPKQWLNLEGCEILFHGFEDILTQEEPIPPFKERFPNKLEGILGSVCQTFNGEYLNKTVLDASASYFNQFVRGYAFENGNKRCAVLFTQWFLLLNDVEFTLTPKEMYTFAVEIALAGENNISSEVTKEWCRKIVGAFTKDWQPKKTK